MVAEPVYGVKCRVAGDNFQIHAAVATDTGDGGLVIRSLCGRGVAGIDLLPELFDPRPRNACWRCRSAVAVLWAEQILGEVP